jgi:hypothetical protein
MEHIVHHNLQIKQNVAYLFYIGKIKTWGLNEFLIDPLAELYKKPVEIIAIMPDFHKKYAMKNTIIINDRAKKLSEDGQVHKIPIPEDHFFRLVSESRFVRNLFSEVLKNQKTVYVNLYQNNKGFTLDNGKNILIISPRKELVEKYNSKINQYKLAKKHGLPVLDFETVKDRDGLIKTFLQNPKYKKSGAYISGEFGMGGSKSLFAHSESDITKKFTETEGPFLMTELIENTISPTVLGVIANKDEVFIATVIDQIMEGPKYRGSVFPSVLKQNLIEKMKEITRKIGKVMGKEGYRGVFGCDFLVTEEEKVYFVEINPRKMGSTLESSLFLKSLYPDYPSIPELEFRAVTQGTFGTETKELSLKPDAPSWGISYVRTLERKIVTKDIKDLPEEKELFHNPEAGGGERISIMEHVGAGTIVERGYLGRVITVAENRAFVRKNLQKGEKMVWETVKPFR